MRKYCLLFWMIRNAVEGSTRGVTMYQSLGILLIVWTMEDQEQMNYWAELDRLDKTQSVVYFGNNAYTCALQRPIVHSLLYNTVGNVLSRE